MLGVCPLSEHVQVIGSRTSTDPLGESKYNTFHWGGGGELSHYFGGLYLRGS